MQSLSLSTMNYQQILSYQQDLLGRALTEGIKRNEDQSMTWSTYKNRHRKVLQALEFLPSKLSISCMVPIGKRALMKGKLVHTNEILICLGQGYFAKYCVIGARAVCNRRIQLADKMLKKLQEERNLYEMRRFIPFEFGGLTENTKDFIEQWNEKELKDWRVLHRQREKKYHQHLSSLRKQERNNINYEELFQRLDELEVEEELGDEMNRLGAERQSFDGDDLQDGEVYYESEEETNSLEDVIHETVKEGLQKLSDIHMHKTGQNSSILNDLNPSVISEEQIHDTTAVDFQCNNISLYNYIESEHCHPLYGVCEVTERSAYSSHTSEIPSPKPNLNNARTDVNESWIPENTDNTCTDIDKVKHKKRISFTDSQLNQNEEVSTNSIRRINHSDDENEIITIQFKHSSTTVKASKEIANVVETPRDIYRMFLVPKTILKKVSYNFTDTRNIPLLENFNADKESDGARREENHDDDDSDGEDNSNVNHKPSAYNIVVKNIQERDVSVPRESILREYKRRPVSKFKVERCSLKR